MVDKIEDNSIFLKPGQYGGVPANSTERAVNIEFTNNMIPLYYSDKCFNKVDYMAENALRSEFANVLIEAGLKYDPYRLDNLVTAILKLLNDDGYTPDKIFFTNIPEHNICDPNFKIVLIETLLKDNKTVYRLTSIDAVDLFREISDTFRLDKPYSPALKRAELSNIDKMDIILQNYVNVNGKPENQLNAISIKDFLKHFKFNFDITKPFPQEIKDNKKEDTTTELVLVKKIAETGESQLVKMKIEDLNFPPYIFDPTLEFNTEIPQSTIHPCSFLTVDKTISGKNRLVLAPNDIGSTAQIHFRKTYNPSTDYKGPILSTEQFIQASSNDSIEGLGDISSGLISKEKIKLRRECSTKLDLHYIGRYKKQDNEHNLSLLLHHSNPGKQYVAFGWLDIPRWEGIMSEVIQTYFTADNEDVEFSFYLIPTKKESTASTVIPDFTWLSSLEGAPGFETRTLPVETNYSFYRITRV